MLDLDKVSHDYAAKAFYSRHNHRSTKPRISRAPKAPETPHPREGHWLIFASWAVTTAALVVFAFAL